MFGMVHPSGESSNSLLDALDELEAALVEDSQLFELFPEP